MSDAKAALFGIAAGGLDRAVSQVLVDSVSRKAQDLGGLLDGIEHLHG